MNKEQTKRLNDLRDWKAMGNEMSINQQAELLHLEELCKAWFETYTPGPWAVQFHGKPHLVATIRLEDGNNFIAAVEGTDSATKDSNRANALLCAAEYIRSAATTETDQRVFAIEQVIREALMQAGEDHEQN